MKRVVFLLILISLLLSGCLREDTTPDNLMEISNVLTDYKKVLIVAKEGADFSTIQSAIDSADKYTESPIAIVIMPGVYKESLNLHSRNISLVGTNKATSIIRNDSGEYANAPLNVSGDAYIANLTFISTHDEAKEYEKPSYAVHADNSGEGTLHFDNCVMISNQNSAIGIGMHQDQTIIIENSYLRKNSEYDGGSLYAHNAVASNATSQLLIIKNSIITTNKGVAFKLDDANSFNGGDNSQMDVVFYNNILYSDELGEDEIVFFRDPPADGGVSGQIKLRADSFGNNVSELNTS